LKRMIRTRKGQGLVEYAMIIVLISMAVIGAVAAFKDGLTQSFAYSTSQISSTLSSSSGS